MSHIVTYQLTDGNSGFRVHDDLSDAVRYIEHVRNDENALEVQLYEATPVTLEFRAYYHVALPEAGIESVSPTARFMPEPDDQPIVAPDMGPMMEFVSEIEDQPVAGVADEVQDMGPMVEPVVVQEVGESQERSAFGIFSRP